ncbi:hypothetical protein L1987_85973 [Smallanthus sonchifolius]|uniref:Uncharacterized protein n=1 Tax=Smallanthus sonchifolius TaxID=185202 RepID=A0ACB8XXI6_9ASTR|nr:hypothetical protein L1987_85973 [Smallanthus sonchifolius]
MNGSVSDDIFATVADEHDEYGSSVSKSTQVKMGLKADGFTLAWFVLGLLMDGTALRSAEITREKYQIFTPINLPVGVGIGVCVSIGATCVSFDFSFLVHLFVQHTRVYEEKYKELVDVYSCMYVLEMLTHEYQCSTNLQESSIAMDEAELAPVSKYVHGKLFMNDDIEIEN